MWFVFDSENKISIVIRICSYGCVGFSRNRDYLRVKYTGGHNVCEYVCANLNRVVMKELTEKVTLQKDLTEGRDRVM